jgi:hypothetical protein
MSLSEALRDASGEGEIADVGIDWGTWTMRADDDGYVEAMQAAFRLLESQKKAGFEIKPYTFQGFVGWRTEGVAVGETQQYTKVCETLGIIQSSSSTAKEIAVTLKQLKAPVKPTRLDFQVTRRFERDTPQHAQHLRTLIKRFRHNSAGGRAPRIKLTEDVKGGNSIAVGSRTSERFYRGYDKTREQKGRVAGWLFRHELELKGSRAVQAWDYYKREEKSEELCLRMVSGHLKTLGVREKWMEEVPALLMPTTRSVTDNERRLKWLENYVTRVVHELLEAGLHDEVEEVLRLKIETKK